METGWLIAITVFYFISGALISPVSKSLADSKGYNGIVFAAITVLCGGIGLLCACALPDRTKKDDTAEAIKTLTAKVDEISESLKKLNSGERIQKSPAIPVDVKPQQNVTPRRAAPVTPRPASTANMVVRDGKLVCSACGARIGFNDKTCSNCGAQIVPADDSEGGFFKKKQ